MPTPDEASPGPTSRTLAVPAAIDKVIQRRLDTYHKLHLRGFLVREAPAEDVRNLRLLLGHLREGSSSRSSASFSRATR